MNHRFFSITFHSSNQYLYHKLTYRVIIKEGHKVNAYYTAKIYLLGASKVFILTTTYEHLFIYTKDLKYLTLNVVG